MAVNSDHELPWWQKILLRIVACGPKINHLAYVMDGNRRYAKKLQESSYFGMKKGGENVVGVLEMARLMGIKEVTFYAWSSENFNRSKKEIDDVTEIGITSLRKVLENIEVCHSKGIKIRQLGDLNMIDKELQKLFEMLIEATKGNSDIICNMAVAYSSRMEIKRAVTCVLEKVKNHQLDPDNVNEEVMEQFLYNQQPVDLWIRTSGETRFSDFLTWQSDFAIRYFCPTMWPEFGILDFLKAVLQYQSKRLKML